MDAANSREDRFNITCTKQDCWVLAYPDFRYVTLKSQLQSTAYIVLLVIAVVKQKQQFFLLFVEALIVVIGTIILVDVQVHVCMFT